MKYLIIDDLLGTNVSKTLEFCWKLLLAILQHTNTTIATSKLGTF